MNLANGLILMCAIFSLGAIALVGFVLWICSPEPPQMSDPNKCLVNIKLAGRIHSFFIDSNFVKSLRAALTAPAGFFEYKLRNGGYAINLACVDYIEIFNIAHEISNGDVDGCSVFLAGKEKSIKVGAVKASLEQICGMLLQEQFIHLGRYCFNRDKIALIVVQDGDKKVSVT